jgi:hypothetical protein
MSTFLSTLAIYPNISVEDGNRHYYGKVENTVVAEQQQLDMRYHRK